ncbi:TIGR04282 family arsenosugar biosynthesis glycosyltransferase [Chloroflexota bacterium]
MKDIIEQNKASLVIFARYPEKGRVKTRLAKTLGAEKATEFYRLCAEHLFRETEKLPPEIERYLYYDGVENEKELREWAGGSLAYCAQVAGGLGQRLENAFSAQFSWGAERVVAVSSDVPDISSSIISEAFRLLEGHEMVIGPCHDGGYYLIGMNRMHREIFKGIPWSTGRVYAQTLAKINQLAISLRRLPRLRDIDTGDDFQQWAETAIASGSVPWGNLLTGGGTIEYKG